MTKSSQKWLREFHSDEYVKKAQKEGYPSRAAYKLLEIQERDKIIKPGMRILDVGAAPGSWTKIARQLVGSKGEVIALDLLPLRIDIKAGVTFIQGDINDEAIRSEINNLAGEAKLDAVISDMAPNLSGSKTIDQPRSMQLVEMAWYLAEPLLAPGGFFLAKLFHGADVQQFTDLLRPQFQVIKWRKPKASRPRSREVYLLALGFKG